ASPSAPAPPFTLALHDALPISRTFAFFVPSPKTVCVASWYRAHPRQPAAADRNVSRSVLSGGSAPCVCGMSGEVPRSCRRRTERSEEHTSELQSPDQLVCRLLL